MNSTQDDLVFRTSRRLALLTCAFALLILPLSQSIWAWLALILACTMYLTLRLLEIGLVYVRESWTHLQCLNSSVSPVSVSQEPTVGRSTIQDCLQILRESLSSQTEMPLGVSSRQASLENFLSPLSPLVTEKTSIRYTSDTERSTSEKRWG